jgi:dihydroflavonol-4-reductase
MPTIESGALAVVTGAAGFVGSNVVRALLARGVRVRAVVRRESDPRALAGLPVERAVADVRDPDALRRAFRGARWAFHVAADYRLWVPDPDAMLASNVLGTRHVCVAAARAGVERLVYTSSVATVSIPADRPGAEGDVLAPEHAIGVYKRSKVLAEQEALAAARRGVPVVVVNPTAPVGPWDVKPTPTGRVVVDYLRGGLDGRCYMDTGLNVVDVRDCAAGHLAAAERGHVGERYILGGENLTHRQVLEALCAVSGGRPPAFRVPAPVAWCFALLDEAWNGRLRQRTPRATREAVRMAGKRMFFDPARGQRELGVTARPAREALAAAVEWFRAHGYAPPPASPVPAPDSHDARG